MMSRWVGWMAVAVLVGSAVGCGSSAGGEAEVGNRAPRFSLTAQDGTVVDSESLKGQVVLLNFWSTTCGPCVRELPHLQQVNDTGRAKVLGVALDAGGWATVRPFLDKHKVQFTVAVGTEELFQRFDGFSLPHSLLLDREQRVVKVYRGPVTQEKLEKDIAALNTPG